MDSGPRRGLRALQASAAAATVALAALAVRALVRAGQGTLRLEELEVEKLTIRETDGKPRLLLTSKDRSPAPVIEGRTFGEPGTRPGMIFYNDEGTEQGGLIVAGARTGTGAQGTHYTAVGHLSFDQFRQDQTVVLRYLDEGGQRRAGLTIQDRPEVPLATQIDEAMELLRLPDGPAKDQAMADLERRYPAPRRVFVGTAPDHSAELVLSDADGRPRIVLKVEPDGNPRIELLDANGNVIRSLTG